MFGVTFLPVLWSPAGAPIAGVPGPRRSADECDAGWFAPVATRRRSMFGVLRPPHQRLAVLHRGDTPRTPQLADATDCSPPDRSQENLSRRDSTKSVRQALLYPQNARPLQSRLAFGARRAPRCCEGRDGWDLARPFRVVGPGSGWRASPRMGRPVGRATAKGGEAGSRPDRFVWSGRVPAAPPPRVSRA
jgi:hypothetical protein